MKSTLLLLISFLLISPTILSSSLLSQYTVQIYKKGLIPTETDWRFNLKGFNLKRNCCYNFKLKNGKIVKDGRLVDIKPDTLYITNYFNERIAKSYSATFDTLSIDYRELENLFIPSSFFSQQDLKLNLDEYQFNFFKDSTDTHKLESYWFNQVVGDSTKYELVPYTTIDQVLYKYEFDSKIYDTYMENSYYPTLEDLRYEPKSRFPLWYIPAEVENIYGVSFGLYSKNIRSNSYQAKDSLRIIGLNIEANPLYILLIETPSFSYQSGGDFELYKLFHKDKISTKIYGINLNSFATINSSKINGINITLSTTDIYEMNGITLSGHANSSCELNGVAISLLSNQTIMCRGLQIGIYNKAYNLFGFQIGIWNVNEDRSLPFINWSF